jgi:hypothetical protein
VVNEEVRDGRNFLQEAKAAFRRGPNPSHVTFDDAKERLRNVPWLGYVEANLEYADLDAIKVEIGDWLVIISGHNLRPLFQAIADRTLTCIRAQPKLLEDSERQFDTFATEIRFTNPPAKNLARQRGQIEFDLGG